MAAPSPERYCELNHMEQAPVTFIVNGNTYSLSAGDSQAIRAISGEDRRQLIALLEAVKEQERLSQVAVQAAANRVGMATEATLTSALSSPSPERMGSGDADALMARLIMEENRNKKPSISTQTLYKWLGVTLTVIVLLVMIL